MKRLVLICSLAAFAAAYADIRAVTPVPQNADPNGWWMKRFAEKKALREAMITNGAPKVVFIGDSITHFWETNGQAQWSKYFGGGTFRALNLGYSADRTEHVLWRIDHGELDGYEAKAIVLMIGTNNSGHFPVGEESPADTIWGIKTVLDRIRAKQPKAKTLLCAIFPRGADANDACRRRNEAVNKIISGFCDGKRVIWCDFTRRMLCADGRLPVEFMPDLLHPGPAGYEVWANAIIPVLHSVLRGDGIVAGVLPDALDPSAFALKGPMTTVPRFRYTPYYSERLGGDWWWIKRIAQRREKIAKSGGKFDLVLLGDSIMHFWEERPAGAASYADLTNRYSVLDCGYAGDMTQDLLWRVQNGELDGYKAKTVVVMIGTNNNTADRSRPAEVAAGVKAVLKVVRERQPQAKIVLHPIFPRGFDPKTSPRNNASHAPAHARNLETNRLIREFADGKDIVWCDFNDKLVDPATGWTTKELMGDSIHPADKGYRIWMEALEPVMK